MTIQDWLSSDRIQFNIEASNVELDTDVQPIMFRLSTNTGLTNIDTSYVIDSLKDDVGSSIPNRKKVMFSQLYEGIETPLYVELDIWDQTNREAVFWIRPKELSSTHNNIFFFYFDKNREDNILISEVHERAESFFMDVGQEGTYDTGGVLPIDVLYVEGIYKMWYIGFDGSLWNMMYCESNDFTTWTNHQSVFGHDHVYDTSHHHPGCVLYEDNLYKMWYSGYNGSKYTIIYCDSPDGITWSNFQMVVDTNTTAYNAYYSLCSCVLKVNGLYKMWYSGYANSTTSRVLYCESLDGVTWINHSLVLDDFGGIVSSGQPLGRPSNVVLKDDIYHMLCEVYNGTAWEYYTLKSKDGFVWEAFTKFTNMNLVGGYDTVHAGIFASMIEKDNKYIYFYGVYSDKWRMFKGESNAIDVLHTPSQEVWRDYIAVHHLNSSYNYKDSTANKLDIITSDASPVTTVLGTSALDLTTSDSYINLGNDSKLNLTSDMGVIVHGNFSSGTNIVDKGFYNQYGWSLFYQDVPEPTSLNDDFSGTDNDPPNPVLWTPAGTPGGYIKDNKLYFSGNSSRVVNSNYFIAGDFDATVDFNMYTAPSTEAWSLTLKLKLSNGYMLQLSRRYSGGHKYNLDTYTTYWGNIGYAYTSDMSGKLRLRRSGNITYGYYHNGADWVQLGSWDFSSLPVLIELHLSFWGGYPTADGDFDNFELVYDKVIPKFGAEEGSYGVNIVDTDYTALLPLARGTFKTGWNSYCVTRHGSYGPNVTILIEDLLPMSNYTENDTITTTHDLVVGGNGASVIGQVSKLLISDIEISEQNFNFISKMLKDDVVHISSNFIQGYTTVYSKAVSTTVLAYKTKTKDIVGICTSSDNDGYYYMEVSTPDECIIVALDGDFYNHHILGKVTPQSN